MKKLLNLGSVVAALMVWMIAAAEAAYIGPFPITVSAGGSGAATFTAHGVLFGEGTSAFGVSATGTSGIPLIGQGGSTDPIFGTAVVGGGGTGLTTLTAHALLIGEGTSNVAFAAAAADSIPLWQSSGADPTVTAINNCTTALTYATASHTFGCNAAVVSPTVSLFTGALPTTLSSTNLVTTVSNMGTPAAGTYNLPASPATGTRACLKDGTTNFSTNNATVKTTDSSTIDAVAGATGIIMNQAHQENCFIFSTNWYIE